LRPWLELPVAPSDRYVSHRKKAFGAIPGEHLTVNHGEREYARGDVYASAADGFGSLLERAKFGVWHKLTECHVQRYVDEVAFRWSNRVRAEVKSKNGRRRWITKLVPVLFQINSLVAVGIGRQLRRTPKLRLSNHLRC
jgi:hypothetical protein